MSRPVHVLITAALCLSLSGCAGLLASEPEAPPVRAGTDASAPDEGRLAIVLVPDDDGDAPKGDTDPTAGESDPDPGADDTDAADAAPATLEDLLGDDGRLSVLILGTDAREGIIGERTDAIIVATIHPGTGKVAMVSMPRDTVDVPVGPDRVYPERINTLYWDLQRSSKRRDKALRKTRKALEYAFETEIDYYALVDFRGLVRLVDAIGGIEVELEEKLHDPTMHLTPKGLKLKAGTQLLDGKTALAYSRTRYTDSDYERSRRQQQVLAAIVARVRERGLAALPALIELVRKKVVTDFPLEAAPLLVDLAVTARLESPKSVVLAPGRFARSGRQAYTIAPKVIEVRKMFDRAFRPID